MSPGLRHGSIRGRTETSGFQHEGPPRDLVVLECGHATADGYTLRKSHAPGPWYWCQIHKRFQRRAG